MHHMSGSMCPYNGHMGTYTHIVGQFVTGYSAIYQDMSDIYVYTPPGRIKAEQEESTKWAETGRVRHIGHSR